jgi:putative transposase
MTKFDRLTRSSAWIDLGFVERERTPRPAIEVGIHLHLAGLSLSNTKRELEKLGVERSRTAIHNWVQKAELQPTSDTIPNQIAVDASVIRVNGQQYWLYAAVDSAMNEFLHARLFPARTPNLVCCSSANSATNSRSNRPRF